MFVYLLIGSSVYSAIHLGLGGVRRGARRAPTPGVGSKQRDPNPNPKDNSLLRKEPSTCKGFHSTFAALLSLILEFLLGLGPLCLLLTGGDGAGLLGPPDLRGAGRQGGNKCHNPDFLGLSKQTGSEFRRNNMRTNLNSSY